MLKRWILAVSVVAGAVPVFVQTLPDFTPLQPDLFAAGASFVNAFADIDGDGDLDLFVGFDGKPNRLYRNDGGVFTDIAAAAGLADARPTRAAAFGDADADGDSDLLVGFTPSPGASVLRFYRNDRGVFTDRRRQPASPSPPAPCVSRFGWTSRATAISTCSWRFAIALTRSSATTAAPSRTRRPPSASPTPAAQ